jgi:hypothetical protein
MRKLILTLVLVMAFSSPSWAGVVKVNGTPYNVDTIMKGDTTYVPVRFVSEKIGAEVGYDTSGAVIINGNTNNSNDLQRPPIYGDTSFVGAINQALDLLQDRDLLHYYVVCQNIKQICIGDTIPLDRSGTVVAYCDYQGIVSFTKEYKQDQKHFVSTHIAGTLAHEATHAMQYKYFPASTSNYKEIEAYNNENLAFTQFGAPEWMIEEAKQMNDTYAQ